MRKVIAVTGTIILAYVMLVVVGVSATVLNMKGYRDTGLIVGAMVLLGCGGFGLSWMTTLLWAWQAKERDDS